MAWEPELDIPRPDGLLPCKYCRGMCMEASKIENDWGGRGEVVRITALCDEIEEQLRSDGHYPERADMRTEFLPLNEAIAAWNKEFGLQ